MPSEHLVAVLEQLGDARRERSCAVDCVSGEVVPAHLVQHDHVERCRGRALLPEAVHVEATGDGPAVQDLVHRPGVAVERERDVDRRR